MVEIASSSQDSLLAKVVLVTGCSSGLGQALATCLHSQTTPDGRTLYKVYATARRLKTLEPLADLGISTLALDVGSEASVKEAVATVLSQEERLDVLVNNAGISKFGPLAEQPLSEVTAVFDTNVMGVLRMTQAVVPSMAARGGGLVVNIGSVSAWLATPYAGAYSASKAALHALSDSLRLELRPFNIQVTTVTAGAITSSFSNNAEAGQSGERYERPGSLYRAHAPSIRARARMSQNSKGVQPASQVAARIAGVINAATAPGAKPPPAWFLAAGGALKLWVLGLLQKVLGRALDSTIAGQFGLA